MVKEKPILFNTEMVRAILDGRKTQTRRVVKPKYKKDEGGFSVLTNKATGERWVEKHDWDEGTFDNPRYVIPPYQHGDILWVREAWYYENHMHDLTAGNPDLPNGRYSHRYVYKADNPDYPVDVGVGPQGWRPSIHMPKAAARLFLRVTNVLVERLNDITDDEARKEGCIDYHDKIGDGKFDDVMEFDLTARDAFAELWNSTIKKKDIDIYGWDANPWVWVIEFEVMK